VCCFSRRNSCDAFDAILAGLAGDVIRVKSAAYHDRSTRKLTDMTEHKFRLGLPYRSYGRVQHRPMQFVELELQQREGEFKLVELIARPMRSEPLHA
jgi:hypothetical protein